MSHRIVVWNRSDTTCRKAQSSCPRLMICLFLSSWALLLSCSNSVSEVTWAEKVSGIVWVAYAPTNADPSQGIEASPDSIRADLAVLKSAGFTGLLSYSSSGVLGADLPSLAQQEGFQGLIMGVWNPLSAEELAAAEAAAQSPIVLGYCIGNEGLHKRYDLSELSAAIQNLREATGKSVTTTEEMDDYSDEEVLQLGDWVFPNVHPYFHHQLEAKQAYLWTQAAYADFKRRTNRFVMFKEVGLPTAGDAEGKMSEALQDEYYLGLANTDVQFAYFEAFDQPWKTHLPIEPHWGIFRSDRTPKLLGNRLIAAGPAAPVLDSHSPEPEREPLFPASKEDFIVYQDITSENNHFRPTGYMGDIGDIYIDEASGVSPHSGETAIFVRYDAEGKGPNECSYPPPCRWAGVYWQEPPNNWGKDTIWEERGFDLSGYTRLTFWARADRPCVVEFKVGGINERYGDSLRFPRSIKASLTGDWQDFKIDLKGADLSHIIGGFVWATNWDTNPGGVAFYLDDIRFEQK